MMRITPLVTLSIFAITVALVSAGEEKEIPLSEVPRELMEKATKLLEGFEPKKADIETEDDGSKTTEISGIHNGVATEMDFNEDGSLQEYEKDMSVDEVPFAVVKAIRAAYPGIEFKRFEASHNEHHKVVKYEVEATAQDSSSLDLEVSPDGRKIAESDA